MNKSSKSTLEQLLTGFSISIATALIPISAAHADWNFGIGTGLTFQTIDGKQGFNTRVGAVKYDVELDAKDFRDLTKSAFGFGGYATDGTWLIQYGLSNLELEDKSDSVNVGAHSVRTKVNFKMKGGEVTVGYPVYKSPSVVTFLDVGLRYTKHEFDNTTTISGPIINGSANSNFSNDWTDVLVGTTINVPLSREWSWGTRFNAGFGETKRSYLGQTGLTWRFLDNWSASALAKYAKVKYENHSMGDSDWYLYDAKEKGLSLVVLYNW